MRKRIILLLILCCVFKADLCYGLDWKRLHEKADKVTFSHDLTTFSEKPDSIDDLYVFGLACLNLHKDKKAEEIFNKIIALDPKVIEAEWGIAEVLRREHKFDKSKELLNKVIKLAPEFSPGYISLAYVKYIQMNFNESARLAARVLRQGEEKVDRSNRSRAYLLLGGSKGMIAYYGGPLSKLINGATVWSNLKAAEVLQPESAEVKLGLGSFYLLAPSFAGRDLKKAEEYLKKAVEIDPLFADSHVRLGQVYKVKGDNAKYQQCLKKALEIDPENELALDISKGKCKFACP